MVGVTAAPDRLEPGPAPVAVDVPALDHVGHAAHHACLRVLTPHKLLQDLGRLGSLGQLLNPISKQSIVGRVSDDASVGHLGTMLTPRRVRASKYSRLVLETA